jgi:hypothetical protein
MQAQKVMAVFFWIKDRAYNLQHYIFLSESEESHIAIKKRDLEKGRKKSLPPQPRPRVEPLVASMT